MIIALDYDGTYTEDSDSWLDFIVTFQQAGHRIVVVTMRYPSEKLVQFREEVIVEDISWVIGLDNIFYTSRRAKKPFMASLGIHPNIWIDDHPQSVFMDAEQIWGTALPEGHTNSENAIRIEK